MKIGQAASLSGLTIKTVRYYADIGMVVPAVNKQTGYRDYAEEDIAKLRFIGAARRFDFSIAACRDLLSLFQDRNRSSAEVKALTLEKITEIDDKLQELTSLRDQLVHLASSCSGDERPDCPILDAFAKPQSDPA